MLKNSSPKPAPKSAPLTVMSKQQVDGLIRKAKELGVGGKIAVDTVLPALPGEGYLRVDAIGEESWEFSMIFADISMGRIKIVLADEAYIAWTTVGVQ